MEIPETKGKLYFGASGGGGSGGGGGGTGVSRGAGDAAAEDGTGGGVSEADYVFDRDCPPSLGLLSLNALVYASEVIVPLQAPKFFGTAGMEKLFDTISMVRQRL